MSFPKYISTYTTTSVEICAVWVTQRHAIAFLKSVKQNVRNDPGNNTKNIINLILENAMPQAIIEVYCSCHSKFVEIIPSSCIV